MAIQFDCASDEDRRSQRWDFFPCDESNMVQDDECSQLEETYCRNRSMSSAVRNQVRDIMPRVSHLSGSEPKSPLICDLLRTDRKQKPSFVKQVSKRSRAGSSLKRRRSTFYSPKIGQNLNSFEVNPELAENLMQRRAPRNTIDL